jgi:hypothetical protein
MRINANEVVTVVFRYKGLDGLLMNIGLHPEPDGGDRNKISLRQFLREGTLRQAQGL